MYENNLKIKKFLIKNWWLVITFTLLSFFGFFSFYLVSSNPTIIQKTPSPTHTRPQENIFLDTSNMLTEEITISENLESLEKISNADERQVLPDSTIKYTFKSGINERPNIFIVQHDNGPIIFERFVFSNSLPVNIRDIETSFGKAPFIFEGSLYYGKNGRTLTYSDVGIAYIVDSENGNVFEQHLFEPMKVEEYIRKYGDDIPTIPEP